MNVSVDRLLAWLEKDFSLVTPINEQGVVASREAPCFDECWIRANQSTEDRFTALALGADVQQAIEKIREIAFKKVFAATGSPELSACASDDLGLVAKAIACGAEMPQFVETLRREYACGRIAS